MRLSIFEGATLIGVAEVKHLDPPMGVVMASFEPEEYYDIEKHANVVDGDYVADRGETLSVLMEDGRLLKSEAIAIHDFPSLDEREVHLLGITEPSFESLFSEHPDYLAYWRKD